MYAQSARKVWHDLQECFQQTNAPKIYKLKQAISNLGRVMFLSPFIILE